MDVLLEKSLQGTGLGKGDYGRQDWARVIWKRGLGKVQDRPGHG